MLERFERCMNLIVVALVLVTMFYFSIVPQGQYIVFVTSSDRGGWDRLSDGLTIVSSR